MQISQSICNIPNNENMKCSRCRRIFTINHFGLKGNRQRYKTCSGCRKCPIIENNDNQPGSSNDHLNIPVLNDQPVVKENDICKDIIEIPIVPEIIEIPIVPEIIEPLNNDQDVLCEEKLVYMFSDFGYNVHRNEKQVTDVIFSALDDHFIASMVINQMATQKDVGLSTCTGKVDLLFAPDAKTIYFMNIKNTNLLDNYITTIKYKNKKRCKICCEKISKNFKICTQCQNECCNECFTKANQKILCCPFCRYTMKSHVDNNIVKYKEDRSKIFKCILEKTV